MNTRKRKNLQANSILQSMRFVIFYLSDVHAFYKNLALGVVLKFFLIFGHILVLKVS